MRLESYTPKLEDLLIFALIPDVRNGFYIDVGAHDPTWGSITKFFYDRGWHGINIEPLKDHCLALDEMRPRDINLCIGLGSEHGEAFLYELPASRGLSTFSKDVAEFSFKAFGKIANDESKSKGFKHSEATQIFTMTEIFQSYCDPQKPIHFCKIDVVGFEKEVLLGVKDWQKFRPWIFCIEATIPMTNVPSYEDWEPILLNNGYQFLFMHDVNRFYLDSRRSHLAKTSSEVEEFLSRHNMILFKPQSLQLG